MRVERIGNATLMLADSEEWVSGTDQDFTDVSMIADPPYGIPINTNYQDMCRTGKSAAKGKAFDAVIGNDKDFDPTRWLIGKDQMFFGANHFAHRLPHNGRWLCWDKRCDIAPPRDQACFELAWCSKYGAGRMFYHLWDGMIKATERGEPRVHPTQKPVALMRWCMQFAKGQTILDPYMGSGTTGVAAIAEGRSFIGIELSEEYFNHAVRRIRAAVDGYTPDMFNTQGVA